MKNPEENLLQPPDVRESDEGDDLELEAFQKGLGDEDDPDQVRDIDRFFDEQEDAIDDFLAELEANPTGLQHAEGESLWVGFDAEWVYDETRHRNRILSIQLYVPRQPALSQDPDKSRLVDNLSRIIFSRGPEPEDRPGLQGALRQLVDTALEQGLIEEEPRLIFIVGFGLRFDLGALSDFEELKRQVDSVSGKIATVRSVAKLEFSRSLITGDGLEPIMIGLHFIDVAAHVPVGKALRDIGLLIELPKLDIPPPYSIERMDEYLRLDPEGYREYAMRDAEIAVRYAIRLAKFALDELKIPTLPATASGLALRWYLRTLKEAGLDRLDAFGLQQVVREAFHTPTRRRRTYRDEEPTAMRKLQDALTTACYAGGRNEAMWLGPTKEGVWTDYDLAGAYSTGLMDLPLIDFEQPKSTTNLKDYLGHVAGYALIDFEHEPATRFPVFAVSRGSKGLIFPLKGSCYATAPEILAAHKLKCKIIIRWGIVYPWRWLPGDEGRGGIPQTRLFGSFVKTARQVRNRLKAKLKEANVNRVAKGLPEMDSLEEQAAKLYLNSVYGKVCQAVLPKNVYDTRQVKSTRLKPSAITNSAVGAHVTGFIRAILAEILNSLPLHCTVLSVTTDGFLTDATDAEIKASLKGPLCKRFQQLCNEIEPGTKMLEVKHRVAQVICMKTRGQLTGKVLRNQKKKKDEKIVLAKAGIQPVVEVPQNTAPEAYKLLQNEEMINLYLNRWPGQKVAVRQFPAIHDQWEKGVDLHKFERRTLLSLEPDLKRKLVQPVMIEVSGRARSHLAMNSQPWQTVEQFDVARARMDGWRRKHNLKTTDDWNSLDQEVQMGVARSAQRALRQATMNLRASKGAPDVLRRAFLRAYANKKLGFDPRPMKYKALAEWLTSIGYETTEKEIVSARSQKMALGCVPATQVVMVLWDQLQAKFPDTNLKPLLVKEEAAI